MIFNFAPTQAHPRDLRGRLRALRGGWAHQGRPGARVEVRVEGGGGRHEGLPARLRHQQAHVIRLREGEARSGA